MRLLAAAVALLALVGVAPGRAADGPGRILVTAGGTGPRSAVVWARVPGPGPVEVTLRAPADGPARREQAVAMAERDFAVKVAVDGLLPRTPYRYEVRWQQAVGAGELVTAPEPGEPAPVTVAWSGDLGGGGRCRHPVEGYSVFRALAARRPDLFLFVGDTIYADGRCPIADNLPGADFRADTLPGYHRKHRYNRADDAVQALFRQTTVEAIWDDHEVVNDFSGSDEPLMPVGRQAFLDYWPIVPPVEEPGRLYRRLRWGRLLEVFVLDTRQYRSPNRMPDGPAKTMLGPAQRAWLLAGLAASDAAWKLVVSSVSLSIPTGRAARDSWARLDLPGLGGARPGGFEHELDEIVRGVEAHRVRNLVWLAADVHHAAVLRHEPRPGVVFHELVAGPLRAGWSQPGILSPTLRPRRLFGGGGFDNFGELVVDAAGLLVRIVDAAGAVRFETRLAPDG